jgi:arylsulfatase A-like enzyme
MLGHGGSRLVCLALVLGACGAEPGNSGTQSEGETPPPISGPALQGDLIFVSIDTLRADHLPFYGYERDTAGDPQDAHSLAWLAEQGTVYDSVWAPIGKTMPSLASFWTGMFPLEHGAISNPTLLSLPSYVQSLADAGYVTHARVANRALQPGMGLDTGFLSYGILPKEREPEIPEALLEQSRPIIAAGEPLMLWAHFMAPHQPYTPAPHLADRFTDRPQTPADNAALYGFHADPASLDEATKQALIGLYDAEILTASGYVQELLAGLDRAYREAGRGSLLEAATVVFFSDHGEELAERHGYFMHAKSLYRGVLHVPLVIAGRGQRAARQPEPRALIDVLPELLSQKKPSREIWAASWQTQFYALRDSRWTLIHNPAGDPHGPIEMPREIAYRYAEIELYDRQADPLELHNLAAKHPAEVERMLGRMHAWYQAIELRKAQFLPGTDPLEEQKRLAALGYLEEVPDALVAPWTVEQWKAR